MGLIMTKFYVDLNGNYLGGFDGVDAPIGGIEIASAPNNALDKWNGTEWIAYRYTPAIVSMRQARLALLQAGLLATVNAAIASDADKITWEYATEVDRNSPLVQNMKTGLNLSNADLDNLFTLAASL